MNNIKKIFFLTLASLSILLILEIIFTSFFIIHKSNYFGPLARIFLIEKKQAEKTVFYRIKFSKKTGMYVPGEYRFNNITRNVNKFGFIGKEINFKNNSNCRIVSLGGSTTAGLESKVTYPEYLEINLRHNYRNCDVLNFGFTGKGLNYLEKILVNRASKFNPNVVSIMSNRNPIMYNSYITSAVANDVINNKIDLYLYKIKNFLYFEVMTYRFMGLTYNRLISLFLDDKNKITSPFNPKNFHSVNYFQNGYKDQILRINSYCKKRGIKLVLVKQAFFIDPDIQKKMNLLSKNEIIEKLKNYNNEKNSLDKTSLFWIYTNAILNKNLDEIKNSTENIILVDPTPTLYSKNKGTFFQKDGLHLNENGNKIIANKIFENLLLHKVFEN